MWLRLVEHLVWDQGAAGSNPVTPRMKSMQILHLHGFPLEKRSELSMKKNLKMILLAAGIIAVIVFELWLWLYVVSV